MRLLLKVTSHSGVTEVETDQAMVDLLGMRGAIHMLKNRAFGRMPHLKRADCTTSFTFTNAHSVFKVKKAADTQRLTVDPTVVWAGEPGGAIDHASWVCPICRHRNECAHWQSGPKPSDGGDTDKCTKCGVTSILSGSFPDPNA